jgi:hypothetical protein
MIVCFLKKNLFFCGKRVVVTRHNFESILPKDHACHICFKLADWFQRRRFLNNFPIGSYVKTMSADGGHFEPRSGSLNTMAAMSRHSFNIEPYGIMGFE